MTAADPAVPRDLVCFSHLRWNFVFQRPQHLMIRWARDRRVFFIEEPLRDSPEPRLQLHSDSSGVVVVTPHLPPGTPNEDGLQRALLEALFAEQKLEDFIAWYYTPMALTFSRELGAAVTVYDCMDELSTFHGAPPALCELERELLGRCDVVFTGGHHLYEHKRSFHPNVHPVPSSVDVEHFSRARTLEGEPEDQSKIQRPRLGFYGVIDERFDIDLIAQLSALRPQWQFVLIGPILKVDPARLPRGPNVHYLGQKSYAQLPEYLAGWDLALLPFALNEATRFISPTKTPEYLAGGVPVVSTPIHDVVRPYGELGLVRIAENAAQFEEAIVDQLTQRDQAREERADLFLSRLSWDRTWLHMKEKVERCVQTPKPVVRSIKPHFDYLVAGAGFSGCVMAERLAQHGRRVLLVDKRPHIGGNAFDHLDRAGILIHKYGPHIFHTNSADVFAYLSRFTQWRQYEHRVLAHVDGKLLPIPINLDTVNGLYGWNLSSDELAAYFDKIAEPRPNLRTSEDVIISKVGRALYEKFFHNYTYKQWGMYPADLDSQVISRIPVRTHRDDRYFTDSFQAMPADGYTALFGRMLDHPNIRVSLGTDFADVKERIRFDELVYTGPIDAYFDHRFGRLPYRSIEFQFETLDEVRHQKVAVINHPNEHAYTRVTEFKHLSGQESARTTLVYEYPCDGGDPYYPVPRPENAALYRQYHALAQQTRGVHFVGRLATYKYYNMDQCVAQALTVASRIFGVNRAELLGDDVSPGR
jgi:UDP-galactopyranose mutase